MPRSDIFYIIDSKKRGELFELLQRFRLFGQAGEQGSEHRSGRSQQTRKTYGARSRGTKIGAYAPSRAARTREPRTKRADGSLA